MSTNSCAKTNASNASEGGNTNVNVDGEAAYYPKSEMTKEERVAEGGDILEALFADELVMA